MKTQYKNNIRLISASILLLLSLSLFIPIPKSYEWETNSLFPMAVYQIGLFAISRILTYGKSIKSLMASLVETVIYFIIIVIYNMSLNMV